jgi:hypothetical protein
LNFRLNPEGQKIDINYVGFADLINIFGGFTSSFGLFASILASFFSEYFYKKGVFNRIFKFVEDNPASTKNNYDNKSEKEEFNPNKFVFYNLKKMDIKQIKNFIKKDNTIKKKNNSKVYSYSSNLKKNLNIDDKNYINNDIDFNFKKKKFIESKNIKNDNYLNNLNNDINNKNNDVNLNNKDNYINDNNKYKIDNNQNEKFNEIELRNFVKSISNNDLNLFDDDDFVIESEKVFLIIFIYI